MTHSISCVLTALVGAAVITAGWAYGGAETWVIVGVCGLVFSALAVYGLWLLRRSRHDNPAACPPLRGWTSVWAVATLSLVLIVTVQLANPSHDYSAQDQGLTMRSHVAWLPTTVSTFSTARALMILLMCTSAYWLSATALRGRYLFRLVGAISISAVVMAVVALLQGSEHEPWDLVGPFLNENTFSSYINLIFPVVLGMASALQQRTGEGYRGVPFALVYFGAGVLATSVLLSGSKAGAAITGGILLTWVWLEWFHRRQSVSASQRRHLGWALVLPIVPVVLLLWLLGADILQSEFGALAGRVSGNVAPRFAVARGAWCMFIRHPTFGVGAGTFHAAYPYFQDASIAGFYRHAHNDWMQWLSEVGIVGFTLGAVAVVAAFQVRRTTPHKTALPASVNRGIALGLLATAAHAVIDFPFQIPAISILVAVWIGVLARGKNPVNHAE